MFKITVVASGKGGVGKSTLCKHLGIAGARSGAKVLIIDTDTGLSSLETLLNCADRVTFSWYDVAMKRCTLKDALIELAPNLHFLAAPREHIEFDSYDVLQQMMYRNPNGYHLVFIDAPAGIGDGLRVAATAARRGIVVATADEISVKGAAAVANVLDECGIVETRILINRYDIKAAKKGKLLTIDEIIDKTQVRLLGIVPEEKDLIYYTVSGKEPDSKRFHDALARIVYRVKGHYTPLPISKLK